jgi:N-carbamoylputrescine amidase
MKTSNVNVAALQCSLSDDTDHNVQKMTDLVRQAASGGAHIVLMPELFEGHYFATRQHEDEFARARSADDHPTLAHFAELARELEVVLPVSFFEHAGQAYYNSIAILDADGKGLGVYRKSHIPDGPGYQEKYYFRPGNTGFKSFATRYARIGVGICWDQWFPEAARAMVLGGADILFYPTAIGSEPKEPDLDTRDPWQRVMVGHAVANACAVVAANRIGNEGSITFYGSSFVANHRGDKLAEHGRDEASIAAATIDIEELHRQRASFGFFRDRRPDLYGPLSDPMENGDSQ